MPATTVLMIRLKGFTIKQTASLQLIDLTGHAVYKQQIRQDLTSLPLNKYSAGTYWLCVQMGDKKVVKRIVKL